MIRVWSTVCAAGGIAYQAAFCSLAFCAIILPARQANAQGSGIARAGVLLTLPADARSLGLGHAAAAASPDEWSTFHSPAQLGAVRRASFGLATESYLAATRLSAVAVALPLGRGTIGISATLLDYGTIQEIATSVPGTDGIETGNTYSAKDNAVLVGYGVEAWRGIRLGAAAEFVSSQVADLSGSGAAFSAGVARTMTNGWDFSGAVQHVGADITLGATRGSLPLTARISAAAPARRMGNVDIRPMIEVRNVRGAGSAAAVAAEATWMGDRGAGLVFRGGYTIRSGVEDDHWPVSFGIGATLGSFALDYAVQRFQTIDQVTHRIGVRVARSTAQPVARPALR